MVKRFLNFVDAETNFGLVSVRTSELLRRFGAANGMDEQQVNTFRNVLECKGIM